VRNVRGALAALAQSAVDNWLANTDAKRFTGPAARGDLDVVDRHISLLEERPELAQLYRLLARRILAGPK